MALPKGSDLTDEELDALLAKKVAGGAVVPKVEEAAAIGSTASPEAMQQAQQAPLSDQPITGGLDAWTRAKLSFKNSQGKYDYLQKVFGRDNVRPVIEGNVIRDFEVRKPDGTVVNIEPDAPEGFAQKAKEVLGDVADVAGDIVQAAPGALLGGAVLTATGGIGIPAALAAGAVGDVAGTVLKNTIGSFIDGSQALTMTDNMKRLGGEIVVNAGTGAITSGMLGVLGKLASGARRLVSGEAVLKGQIEAAAREGLSGESAISGIKRVAGVGEQGPRSISAVSGSGQSIFGAPGVSGRQYAENSSRLEDVIRSTSGAEDFAFTPGQAIGSPRLLGRERMLRQNAATADLMGSMERDNLQAAGNFVKKTTDALAAKPDALGNFAVGDRAVNAIKSGIKQMKASRRDAVDALYREAEASGEIINPSNAMNILKKKAEADLGGANDATARAMLREYDKLAKGTTPTQFQSFLQSWGDKAKGKGTILEGMTPGGDQAFAKKVLGALQKDLTEAAESGTTAGAKSLRQANALWREHTQAIDNALTGPIKSFLKLADNDSVEKIPARMMELSDRELRGIFRLVDRADSSAGNDLRVQFMRNLAEDAGISMGGKIEAGVADDVMSPEKFRSLLKKHESRLVEMWGSGTEGMKTLENYKAAFHRLASQPGYKGSDTFPKFLEWTAGQFGGVSAMIKQAIADGKIGQDSANRIVSSREGAKWLTKMYNVINQKLDNPSKSEWAARTMARIVPHVLGLAEIEELNPDEVTEDGTPTSP